MRITIHDADRIVCIVDDDLDAEYCYPEPHLVDQCVNTLTAAAERLRSAHRMFTVIGVYGAYPLHWKPDGNSELHRG